MASDYITPEEQRLITHEQEELDSFKSAVAESRVIDSSPPREGSPSSEVPLDQLGSDPHNASPSHSITDEESNESRDWISAHLAIQRLEQAIKVASLACLELQSLVNAVTTLVNAVTTQFSNISPTEVDSSFGFHDDGPAVLSAVPESTIFTPESITKAHQTCVLTRPPCSVFVGREPGRTPAWILSGPESSHVGPQRLTSAEREQLAEDLKDPESSDLGLQFLSVPDLEQSDEEQHDED